MINLKNGLTVEAFIAVRVSSDDMMHTSLAVYRLKYGASIVS